MLHTLLAETKYFSYVICNPFSGSYLTSKLKIVHIVFPKILHYVMTDKQSELFIKFGKINWLWFYNNVYDI